MASSPHLSLVSRPARENPLEFRDETYPTKTRGMGLPYGVNFIIITSTVLYDTPVWQTDRGTDGRAIACSRSRSSKHVLCYISLSRAENPSSHEQFHRGFPFSKLVTGLRRSSIFLFIKCNGAQMDGFTAHYKNITFTFGLHILCLRQHC